MKIKFFGPLRLLSILFAFYWNVSFPSESLISDKSIGNTQPAIGELGTLKIENWIGHKFIFLPRSRSTRQYGYQLFKPKLSYDEWVGKTITVLDVKSDAFNVVKTITFKADNGKKISAEAFSDTVEGIAPLEDLEYARANFLEKKLWLKRSGLSTWDSETGKFGLVNAKRCAPVTVTDIIAGWYGSQPIRFILKTDSGETGFIDTAVSDTNVPHGLQDTRFTDRFFTADPHETYRWSNEVWSAIEKESVFVGMTAEQAILSWGAPKKVNVTTTTKHSEEQWVYRIDRYLYVSDGVITAIQN